MGNTYKDFGEVGYAVVREGQEPSRMFPAENTIYSLRYNFDLGGKAVAVPSGCALLFDGGRLLNGSVKFDGTLIRDAYDGAFADVEISGSIANGEICAAWFRYGAGHDDFQTLKCLCENSARVRLGGMTFTADMSRRPGDSIRVGSNTAIDGEGAVIDAGHSADGWNSLFDVTQGSNIEFKNFAVNCDLGVEVDPPIDHDGGKILSSGVYAICVNDWCSGLRVENVRFNNVGYALKTTRHAAYKGMSYFENISVSRCSAYADMPIQGSRFANFRCDGCALVSRGTNSGNHAVYMLSITDPEYAGADRSMRFSGCLLRSMAGDGQVVQIYASGDDGDDRMNKCFFSDCEIVGECSAVTCSKSADVYFCNCSLRSASPANCNPDGGMRFVGCDIENYVFYRNAVIRGCGVRTSGSMLVGGCAESGEGVVFLDDDITCPGYMVYNNSDGAPVSARGCDIAVGGDGLISQRGAQAAPLRFCMCRISVKARLCYCPGKTGANTFAFSMCDLTSSKPDHFFETNSDGNVLLRFSSCALNGETVS